MKKSQIEMLSNVSHKNNSIPNFSLDKSIQDIPEQSLQKILKILGEDHKTSFLSSGQKVGRLFLPNSLVYIDPMSIRTSIWNFITIFVAYFLTFQISLTLAFGEKFWSEEIQQEQFFIAYVSLMVLLFFDVLVNFNKGYYGFGKGKIIDDKKLIIRKYLSYHFPLDAITLILLSIPLYYSNFYVNFVQLIPLVFLMIKKFKCQEQIIGSLKYSRSLRNLFILFMLGCDVLLIGNFGACLFVGIDLFLWHNQYYGSNPTYYWLSNDSSFSVDLIDGPWDLQYVFAQSFSTGTLSTLAPGPFGKNPIQILYAIFVMTFFMLIASYAGEVVVQVIYSYEEVRIFHENNIQKFDQFMTLKGVSDSIKQKVHNFFQLIWEVEIKMDVDRQRQTLDKFPLTIKEQLLLQMGFCRYLRIFTNFSKGKILEREISMKIVSEVIDEGTLIFQTKKLIPLQKRYLFYLKSGLSKFYFKNVANEDILALSNVQKTVGQFQFVTGMSYSYCCKAIDLCVVQKILFADFIELLQLHTLMEQYYLLKYWLLVEQKVSLISKRCIICQGDHLEIYCSEINMGFEIREDLRKSEGFLKVNRKKINRKYGKSKKLLPHQLKIEVKPKDVIPSIFSRFKGLGQAILGISKNQKDTDQLFNFDQYFPQYNIINSHV